MAATGEQLAKVALIFVGMAGFNAVRRGELRDWLGAKFANAGAAGSPLGPTPADIEAGQLALVGAAIGGAVGTPVGIATEGAATTAGTGGTAATPVSSSAGIVAVPGITGGLSAGFAAKWVPMAAAARRDGVILTGGGWRSSQRQIELRAAHGCGGSRIYDSSCRGNPPTAVPGRSRHETGDAVDVKLTGAGGRNSPEYRWLAANAGRFGVYNLPSEAWHWSKDGH